MNNQTASGSPQQRLPSAVPTVGARLGEGRARRRRWAAAGLLFSCLLMALPPARGQAPPQGFSADLVTPPNQTEAIIEEVLPELNPVLVVTVFEQACLLTGANPDAAIDWAMANDFDPPDPASASVEAMLGGEPGTVLAAPGTGGRVMLAVSAGQCSVWAERTLGPPLRAALMAVVEALSANGKGRKAQLLLDRHADRAGAWRNQMEWRYRAAGSLREWRLGAATTLGERPGTQVLHMAPLVVEEPGAVSPGR